MKMLDMIKVLVRRWAKRRHLNKVIKARGGHERLALERKARRDAIKSHKETIARSLILSWNLKEIRPPRTKELYNDIRFFHQRFSLKQLLEIEKWHWS